MESQISEQGRTLFNSVQVYARRLLKVCVETGGIHNEWFPSQHRYMMVNPKDYRVVVVESLFAPLHFRNTLAKVLFHHFNVCICTVHVKKSVRK